MKHPASDGTFARGRWPQAACLLQAGHQRSPCRVKHVHLGLPVTFHATVVRHGPRVCNCSVPLPHCSALPRWAAAIPSFVMGRSSSASPASSLPAKEGSHLTSSPSSIRDHFLQHLLVPPWRFHPRAPEVLPTPVPIPHHRISSPTASFQETTSAQVNC